MSDWNDISTTWVRRTLKRNSTKYWYKIYHLYIRHHSKPLVLFGINIPKRRVIFNKYKTFSVLIYSYIKTSGNWENEKLCGNTTPEGRSVFTQFRVFPIFTSVDITIYQYGKNILYLFYNIAQRNIKKEIFRRFRVDIELYQLLANQRSEFTNAIL
jgi:hypothetical protein